MYKYLEQRSARGVTTPRVSLSDSPPPLRVYWEAWGEMDREAEAAERWKSVSLPTQGQRAL